MRLQGNVGRKGYAASSLIGIILLILILWIIFLPPAERNKLLDDKNTSGSGSSIRNATLLSVNIGSLAGSTKDIIDHPIPTMLLTELTSAIVLSAPGPVSVSHSLFSGQDRSISFSVPALTLTDAVRLSFRPTKRQGVLTMTLNDVVIYDETPSASPQPLTLPKGLLKESNTMVVSVSSPGIAFWRTNEYVLDAFQIVGDVRDEKRQSGTSKFVVENDELSNFKNSFLEFVPACDTNAVGLLSVTLNNRKLFEGVPDCSGVNRQDLSVGDLLQGTNTILFNIAKGKVRIDQAHVHTTLTPTKSKILYFPINQILFDEIGSGISHVSLKFLFVNDGKSKEGVININGKYDTLDQTDSTLLVDISNDVVLGNNYVEIVPKSELNIVRMDVRVE